jgi:hypothetical protein
MAHRSRWGWHPCDYPTYLLLKELHGLYERAQHQYAAWRRWQRKKPHNRVVRRKITDETGNKVGEEIGGPRPEPPLPPLFCVRRQVPSFWSEDGKPIKTARLVEQIDFDDHSVAEAYRTARTPMPNEKEVKALPLAPEEVRALLERARE